MLLLFAAVPQQSVSVKGEVKLKQEQLGYHPDYKNHSSKRFKELSSSFESNVSMLPMVLYLFPRHSTVISNISIY